MRHRKYTFKLGRNSSHKRCLMANMLKSLLERGRIETTLPKAKHLKRRADKLVSLAKKDNLASLRRAKALLMIRFNKLDPKEQKKAKNQDFSVYNTDRKVLKKLSELKERFKERKGGYTRIIKKDFRVGDGALKCLIEFVE